MKEILKNLLIFFLGPDHETYRQRAGGKWYYVREEIHPAAERWRREPPDGSVYENLLDEEDYK